MRSRGVTVGLAAVTPLDALEGLGLDQQQRQGAAVGETGGDAVELLVRMQRKHGPPRSGGGHGVLPAVPGIGRWLGRP